MSHASKDVAIADDLVRQLETAGIPCWIAPRDIPAGSDYATEITRAIRAARATLFVYSIDSNDSAHCLREIELAIKHGVEVIPVRLDSAPMRDGLEYRLSTAQWVDLADADALPAIARRLGALPVRLETPAAVVGVPAFRFGPDTELVARDAEVAALDAVLDEVMTSRRGRLVMIGGESGVGKSAVLGHVAQALLEILEANAAARQLARSSSRSRRAARPTSTRRRCGSCASTPSRSRTSTTSG